MDLCPLQPDGVSTAVTPGQWEPILYLISRNEQPGGAFFCQNPSAPPEHGSVFFLPAPDSTRGCVLAWPGLINCLALGGRANPREIGVFCVQNTRAGQGDARADNSKQ